MIILEKTCSELEEKHRILEKDFIEVIILKNELELEIIKYKKLSKEAQNEVQSLEYLIKKDLIENESKLASCKVILNEKKVKIINLENMIEEHSKKILKRELEIKRMTYFLEKPNEEVGSDKINLNETNKLKEELENFKKLNEELKENMKKSVNDISSLRIVLEEKREENDSLINLLEKEEKKVENSEKIIKNKNQEIELMKAFLNSEKRNNESLNNELEKQKKDINCYKIDLSEQIRKSKELERELNELKKKKDTIEIVEDVSLEIENKLEDKVKVISWNSLELYLEHKSDAFELIKNFSYDDFKELYKEADSKNLIKALEKKKFNDVLTRVNLKMPLSRGILQTVEAIYLKLMKEKEEKKQEIKLEKTKLTLEDIKRSTYYEFIELYQSCLLNKDLTLEDKKLLNDILRNKKMNIDLDQEIQDKIDRLSKKLNGFVSKKDKEEIQDIEKKENISENSKEFNENIIYDFYEFTSKDWFELSRICKGMNNISSWLKNFIFSLGIEKESKGFLSKNQIRVIERYYLDLKAALDILKIENKEEVESNQNAEFKEIVIEEFNITDEIESILF